MSWDGGGGWTYLVEKTHPFPSALGPGVFPAAAQWGGIVCLLLRPGVTAPAGPSSLGGGLGARRYVHEWPRGAACSGGRRRALSRAPAELPAASTAADAREQHPAQPQLQPLHVRPRVYIHGLFPL